MTATAIMKRQNSEASSHGGFELKEEANKRD
jgi:hypothetical protein